MDLDKYFKKAELIPAIVTDIDTGAVLMLAYMNKESLKLTLETGYTWFWSRSRQELWNKGATSLLVRVKPAGPACHTGSYTCFFKEIYKNDEV